MKVRSDVVVRRTYARPTNKEETAFESWKDIATRVRGHQEWLWERAKGSALDLTEHRELDELVDLMVDKKLSTSGRTLWLGGTEVSKKREASQFNCSFTEVETVYDVVDVLWLLMQGCGVGFKPIVGTLNGFFKPIPKVTIKNTKRLTKGGLDYNEETFKDGVWTIKVGDSAEAWAKSIGKLLSGKHNATELVFDFTELRPAGERLTGYGWISSGDSAISVAYKAIAKIMNKRAGQLLTRMDILDTVNWLGTILSSRRSAQIALFEYGKPEWREFAVAKRDFWEGNIQRGQSNNSLVFYDTPARTELVDIFQLMEDSGGSEPGFVNGAAALTRAPWFKGSNPCILPDSYIETVEGRVKIKDIKEPIKVYTMLEDGSLGIKQATASWISKRGAETLEITTRMGHTIKVTPDHKVFTKEKGWVEAQNLKIGDTLIHLRRSRRGAKYSGVSLTSDKRTAKDCQVMEHRLVYEATHGKLPEGYDVHHLDGDTYNNSIDNLEALSHSEHSTITRHECDNNHMVNGAGGRYISTGKLKPKDIKPMPKQLHSAPTNQFSGKIVKIEEGITSDVYDMTVEGTHNFIADFTVVHNCCEILLGNKNFCNLVEIDIAKFIGDSAGLHRTLEIGARANYRQTCVNLEDGILQEAWHLNNEFLRLCGVGLTGIAQRDDLGEYDIQAMKNVAISAAYSMADELGLQRPKNVTTVKPSGTLSKVMSTTEGVHKPLGKYIFNNINFGKNDPLLPKLEEAGYFVRPNPLQPDEGVIVQFPVKWEHVEFDKVVNSNGEVLEVNNETAITQLERYKKYQVHWCQQNVSNTISYSPDEVPEIINWLLLNWEHYVGVSFLYRADPSKSAEDLGYLYLPQEVTTKKLYEEYTKDLRDVDFGDMEDSLDNDMETQECSSGACPVI